jgi:hypothetical protein
MATSLKPSQMSNLLGKTIPLGLPVMIKGPPGIGKSDICDQAAMSAEADFMVMHPVVSDPTDAKGMPWVYKGKGGKPAADFIPFNDLKRMIDAKRRLVVLLDDLGQAPRSVQAAFMQLILARKINGHQISKHVTFLAATNRKRDKAGVSGILEPVKSRFATIVELSVDVDDWVAWALTAGLPIELIAFIRFRPALLHKPDPTYDLKNAPCPRTVHNVGKLFQAGIPQDVEFPAYSGAAGEAFATEFMGFLKVYRNLPDIAQIRINPGTAPVPSEVSAIIAVCCSLAKKCTNGNIGWVFKYIRRLPIEYQCKFVMDANIANPTVASTREFVQWESDNKNFLFD